MHYFLFTVIPSDNTKLKISQPLRILMSQAKNSPATAGCLYYDGQCPLCKTEIDHLSKIAGDELALENIHNENSSHKSKKELLQTLHFKTDDGRWLTGLDATVAAWSHTRWAGVFAALRWPLIKPIADWVYKIWAKRRFAKRYGAKPK